MPALSYNDLAHFSRLVLLFFMGSRYRAVPEVSSVILSGTAYSDLGFHIRTVIIKPIWWRFVLVEGSYKKWFL